MERSAETERSSPPDTYGGRFRANDTKMGGWRRGSGGGGGDGSGEKTFEYMSKPEFQPIKSGSKRKIEKKEVSKWKNERISVCCAAWCVVCADTYTYRAQSVCLPHRK